MQDKLPQELREDILDQFDISMKEALTNMVTNRVTITGKIESLRHVSDVYMIMAQDCKIVYNGLKNHGADISRYSPIVLKPISIFNEDQVKFAM
jgi:hypothetical protein